MKTSFYFRVTARDFVTVNHEMGHIQYQRSYRNLSFLYQEGANPGFHEAVGDILSLAVGNYLHLHLNRICKKIY
jgi:hypothetical protein